MRKNIFATSLTTALLALPLLAACKGGGTMIVIPPQGLTLPDCAAGQLIAVGQDKVLGCTQALTTNLSPPNCPSGYALNAFDGNLACMPVGNGTTTATDVQVAIQNIITKTTEIQNKITMFGGGGGAARYCGLTANNTTGRILNGTSIGVKAAAELCTAVAACGAGAHMCTPYELFESASAGVLTQTADVAKSWVYMAAWQNTGVGNEPTAGLHDNCGGYTYGTNDLLWRGTAMKWEGRNNNEKVLKIYTANNSPEGAACNLSLPIACCK